MTHRTLSARVIGYVASLIFTVTAFLIVYRPDFFHVGVKWDIALVLILAILQFIAQSICFLNVWGEKGPRWNLLIFISTISVIFIIIVGSIWIMDHLDYNMKGLGGMEMPAYEGF